MLSRIVTMFAAISGGAATLLAEDKSAFVEHRSKVGMFVAKFPGKPDESSAEMAIRDGSKSVLYRLAFKASKDLAYLVSYNDWPAASVPKDDPQALLKFGRDGNVGTGKLLDDTEAEFGNGKWPMRVITFEKDSFFLRNKLILVGNRMYQITVVAADCKVLDGDEAKAFFEGFGVTK